MGDYPKTPRTRLRRAPKRAAYDRATVHAILDQGIVCHVGYVIDDQPFVTPTLYCRDGERLYWHGSSASRMLRELRRGIPASVTVTLLDGLVMARSGFHHSVNYRSVMVLGTAELVPDTDKERHLERFMERLSPGRWATLRPPNTQEMKATTVLSMAILEVSAKIRTGDPVDDEGDYDHPVWAGVVPLRTVTGALVPDPRLLAGVEPPAVLVDQARFGWQPAG